ncbi:HAMP domain-containing protein [Cohnella sp. CFH 77786]|uniref:sensor histidine kinase n=1 Tax=Cohnella sp. CFH 77786 TaxID=2662265 RepID=UPI001C60E6C2|nr:sensor histidine kinase [Cohnella sp. CFH 77786]MBW5445018.1 HAMP domain-containing protein [Cohnella sp. CFH 77786]
MSLSKRIFAAFIAFIIVPMFVLGSVSYLVFQHINQDKYAEQTEMTLKAIGRNINNMIREANAFSDFWVTTKDSVESLQGAYDPSAVSEEAKKQNQEYESLREQELLRRRVLLTSPDLKSVTLYRNDKRIIKVNYIPDTTIPLEELESNPVYEEVLRKNGAPVWIAPYEDSRLTGANNLFTQIRVLLDVDTLKNKGILVIRYQMRELNRIFDFYGSNESKLDRRYLIVGKNGTVLYDSLASLEGARFPDLTDTSSKQGLDLSTAEYQSKTLAFQGVKSLVSVADLQDLKRLGIRDGWKLVSVTPWRYLSGDMEIVLRWMAAIMIATLACAVLFHRLFVRRTISFINRVVKAMRRVERGDLTTQVPVMGNDETTSLSKGFNRLVRRVSELLEDVKQEQRRKRKAEMMLLQAQIKPHFLFNALESINILAIQNEGRKVSKMVRMLAKILRISIQQKEEIRVEQELEHLHSYLEIQKYRFDDLFEYEIDVPLHLLGEHILKLTLQPLVENSIQHGFEGIGYMGRIRVTAREEGGRIAFFVEDNGIGIPEERLALFAMRGETSLEEIYGESPESGERRGLGLGNVADRLRIHYGPSCGLILCSSPGFGTVIKCVIPKTAGGDTHEA